jgi:hypothetical protein
VLSDHVRHPGQPCPVSCQFKYLRRREIFNAIASWTAQWLEKASHNKNGYVMHLAIHDPSGLLCREPRWKLPQQHEEPMLVVTHCCLSITPRYNKERRGTTTAPARRCAAHPATACGGPAPHRRIVLITLITSVRFQQ